jgi:DHA2 family multidrug resistance protein
MGYTATWAGIVSAPVGFLALLLSPVVGKNIHRLDARVLARISFLVFAIVCFMRAKLSTDVGVLSVALPQFIQGIAMATFFVPLTALLLSGLPPERIPAASGLANFVRITCGAMGASISTTMWERRAAHHHARLAELINPYNPVAQHALDNLGSVGMNGAQAAGAIERQINVQAFTMSAVDFFWLSGTLFLVMIVLLWLAKPGGGAGAPADAGGAH